LAGNAWVAYYNGVNTREQEQDRSTASLNEEKLRANNALDVEREKAKATLILQAISTNDATRAYQNLQFFIESGVLIDKEHKIIDAAKKYPAFLPASGPLSASDTDPLGSYNADPSESSVSGFASGAFMAVQFATAWSSAIKGVGIIAGGPEWCAQDEGDGISALVRATGPCAKGPVGDLEPIFFKIDGWAQNGEVDDPAYLKRQKIYIFHGYNDSKVGQSVTDATLQIYLHYVAGNMANIFYQTAIGAGNSQVISANYGLECNENRDYAINNCGYDQAGILLQHIYGKLNPKNMGTLSGTLKRFNQAKFTAPVPPINYGMADIGYVYVPATCEQKHRCRVHIALHGCKQDAADIQDRYLSHAGYVEWADTNNLIILFPQTVSSNPIADSRAPTNPFACWDWWGYTNPKYATKSGRQISAIKAMLDRIGQSFTPAGEETANTAAVPPQAIANDVSDTSIALAWQPIVRAKAYRVYRSASASQAFELLGEVAGPSFVDSGLQSQTGYRYTVSALQEDGKESGPSAIVTQATLTAPQRCATPGRCPI
jgi:hypothetical protein